MEEVAKSFLIKSFGPPLHPLPSPQFAHHRIVKKWGSFGWCLYRKLLVRIEPEKSDSFFYQKLWSALDTNFFWRRP